MLPAEDAVTGLCSRHNHTLFITAAGELFLGRYKGEGESKTKGEWRRLDINGLRFRDAVFFRRGIMAATDNGDVIIFSIKGKRESQRKGQDEDMSDEELRAIGEEEREGRRDSEKQRRQREGERDCTKEEKIVLSEEIIREKQEGKGAQIGPHFEYLRLDEFEEREMERNKCPHVIPGLCQQHRRRIRVRRIAVGGGARRGEVEEIGGRREAEEKMIEENEKDENKGGQKEQEEQEEEEHLMLLTSRGEVWLQGKGPAIGIFSKGIKTGQKGREKIGKGSEERVKEKDSEVDIIKEDIIKTEKEGKGECGETERNGQGEGEDDLVTRRLDYLLGRQVIGVAAGRGFSLALVDPLDPPDPPEGTPLSKFHQNGGSPCRLCSPGKAMPEVSDNDGDADGESGARKRCPLGLSLSPRKEPGKEPGSDAKGEWKKDPTGPTVNHSSDPKRRKNYSEGSEFEIVECDEVDEAGERESTKEGKIKQEKEGDGNGGRAREEKGGGGGSATAAANSLFINADAARQFISRQLSWMTSAQETRDNETELVKDEKKEDERVAAKEEEDKEEEETLASVAAPTTPRKYADAATELIRENVASAATLVVSGVRTVGHKVGHKVGRLSRHFSGASAEGVVEGQEENDDDPPEELAPSEEALALTTLAPAAEALDQEGQVAEESVSSPPQDAISATGAASCGTHSLPRRLRDRGMERARGSHVRTASAGGAFPFLRGRAAGRSRTPTPEEVVAEGKRALGTEVWAWGSSYKGQLGTGDLRALRPTPTCLYTLNHLGVAQVVCGDAHSAARTLDGQVYVWGDTSSDQLGPPPPPPLPLSFPSPSLMRRSSPYPSPSSNRRSSPVSSSSSNSSATSSFCSISPHSQGIKYPQRLRLPSEEEGEEEVDEDDKVVKEEGKEEKEGGRTGDEKRKDERENVKKLSKQDEGRKRTEVKQEKKRRKREIRKGEELAVDIAAGSDFLLIVTITGKLLYVGTLRQDGPSVIRQIPAGFPTTKITSVLAHGDSVVCGAGDAHPQVVEFLVSESRYLALIKFCHLNLLKAFVPLSPAGETKHIQDARRVLSLAFEDLVFSVAASVRASLTALSSASTSSSSVRPHILGIVTQVEALREIYRRYVSAVCDALALGCLPLEGGGGSGGKGAGGGGAGGGSAAQCAAVALLEACRSGTVSLEEAVWKRWEEKAACPTPGPASSSSSSYFSSGVPSVSSSSLSSVWNSSSLSSSSISASNSPNSSFSLGSEVTRYILVTRPLERIRYYETFLKEVLRNDDEGGRIGGAGERDRINFAYSHWRLTANFAYKMQIEAEATRTFWDANAGLVARLPKELFSPVRRLIRDSKMHPISLHNAGRFSSHSFILMSGVLLHIQYSSVAIYPLDTMWVETVPAASSVQNGIVLTMPEETLTLTCPSGPDKTQWLRALQEAVRRALLAPSPIPGVEGGGEEGVPPPRSPPLVRNATYTFTKSGPFKDATYRGQWLCGKPHGLGILSWSSSGTVYEGQFRQGLYHGLGVLHTPLHPVVSSSSVSSTSYSSSGSASAISSSGYSSSYFSSSASSGSHTSYPTSTSSSSSSSSSFVVMQEGMWISGKMVGQAVIRYANGDVYAGQVKDGLPSGHGVRKTGHFGSQAASVYTGEWSQGVRAGYGVLDDIVRGEKYMGLWQADLRQGPGMVVTMNGVYYEGSFHANKLTGPGLVILEDGTQFEGEVGPGGSFAGKGILCYPSGDAVEGSFNGSFPGPVKISGVLRRGGSGGGGLGVGGEGNSGIPRNLGKHSVPADKKWQAIIRHCQEQLGLNADVSVTKLWERLAIKLHEEQQILQKREEGGIGSCQGDLLDGLDHIPDYLQEDNLTYAIYDQVRKYLGQAFLSRVHPLGQLLQALADAFRASYGGVAAHPRLLSYAVQEIHSLTQRVYQLVKALFPILPGEGENIILQNEENEGQEIMVTPATLLQPWLLPQFYSPLSSLYVLDNQPKDDEYWRRLLSWNKQPDVGLMTFLGVDPKFWLEDIPERGKASPGTEPPRPSSLTLAPSPAKEGHFSDAIETLQLLSTAFSPRDKLAVIQKTFECINERAVARLGRLFQWTMDDLFPVMQFVVVRSRIQHLGAEIRLVEDLLDDGGGGAGSWSLLGELGLMFTTLKACYYQIQNEKVTYLV